MPAISRCPIIDAPQLQSQLPLNLNTQCQLRVVSGYGRSMLEGPNRPEARNMLIELILSIPARLSDLLVVLTSLMRPLVMALQEGQELVGLGLRTLEYWVDRCLLSPLPPCNKVSNPLLVCFV